MIYWIYKDKDGLWRWYLKSANDEKIAELARVTATKQNANTLSIS